MEVYSPALPKIAYIGDRAAPGAHPLAWLAQQCEVQVFPENSIGDAMRELERTHVLLLDVHSIHAHLICQQLRREERSQQLPVLGLGNRLPAQDVIRLLHHGAVDVVALPTDYEILLARIRTLAYRQIEIMMTRTINRTRLQDLERIKSALQGEGRDTLAPRVSSPSGLGASPHALAAPPADNSDLLDRVERHAAALPEHVALFVISTLASTELLPLNLSSLILNALTRRIPLSKLGPIHHAFADLVKRHLLSSSPPDAASSELAMLQACGCSGSAIEALRFVADLPGMVQREPHSKS